MMQSPSHTVATPLCFYPCQRHARNPTHVNIHPGPAQLLQNWEGAGARQVWIGLLSNLPADWEGLCDQGHCEAPAGL